MSNPSKIHSLQRREFLRQSSLLGGALAGAAPFALNLAAIGEAAAQSATDYKAIVCVFLNGGNDYANTVIPYDNATYNTYQTIRQNLAYSHSALAATVLQPTLALGDRQMALAPALAPLKGLFDSGNLGVLLNIGTLVVPTTIADYKAQRVPLPPKLFSHNDQASFWQSSKAEGGTTGWGGRLSDLMLSSSGNAMFTAISVNGGSVFLNGNATTQYGVSAAGPRPMISTSFSLFGSRACQAALRTLITQPNQNQIANAYVTTTTRSLDGNARLSQALASVPALATQFDATNTLAMQLQMVARLIAARNMLGLKRQVFFVSLGGFDTHDGLASQHPVLMKKVADALNSFFLASKELGVDQAVTTFTASDFGRTLTVNSDGSDHGWGSHHFVLGGAVAGKAFFGKPPSLSLSRSPDWMPGSYGPNDVGQGRLLPTTSVDQLGASLASWFGVASSDMKMVLPNSSNFDLTSLNLFKPVVRKA